MSIQLPSALPTASGWQFSDWADVQRSSTPAAGGLATIELDQLAPDEMWLLDHMVVQCTSTSATRMRLYTDSVTSSALWDGTDTGNFDVGDWPSGLLLRPSSNLVAQWTGCSAGAVATLRLQARLMRRVS